MSNLACMNDHSSSEQCTICQDHNISNIPNFTVNSGMWTFRPHGNLARALYEKQLSDEHIDSLDKNQWYTCNMRSLPTEIANKFIKLSYDEETEKFLKQATEKSDWILMQLWHIVARSILAWFMTQTSINGLLGRGSMFVLSLSQFKKLLRIKPDDETWRRSSLLDLGAGDGKVTAQITPLFDKIYVTEISHVMRGILQKRGYHILNVEDWNYQRYDVISCLNLLDRCDTPLTLLKQIKHALKPDGFLIIALVLPVSQYVESGRADHKPTEILPIEESTFEEQVTSVIRNVFRTAGFKIFSWTKVPYLCEGDLKQCYYWLDDAIFVLQPINN